MLARRIAKKRTAMPRTVMMVVIHFGWLREKLKITEYLEFGHIGDLAQIS
jgi:hypothetical protein